MAGEETAEYAIVESDGVFELRSYDELTVASTEMDSSNGGNRGFMRLFGYINGDSNPRTKIAMTTPVFMESQNNRSGGRMSFVLPAKVATDGAPNPANSEVEIQTRPAGKYAVIRFNGRMNATLVEKARKRLQVWIESKGYEANSGFESASYDPPWTPASKRRNEVLIRLK